MTPNPVLQRFALVLVITGYAALFGWLGADTWHHSAKFDVRTAFTATIPPLAGALGVMLAHGLGVDPKTRLRFGGGRSFLVSLLDTDRLLLAGAVVYMLSGIAGIAIWIHKGDDVTPALLSTIALTVVGYLVASGTTLAGGNTPPPPPPPSK
jgi:hypothetical protein